MTVPSWPALIAAQAMPLPTNDVPPTMSMRMRLPPLRYIMLRGSALRARDGGLVEVPFARPVRELVAARELQLAKYRRDVTLDGLGRDGEILRDVLIRVAARDESQYLAFT